MGKSSPTSSFPADVEVTTSLQSYSGKFSGNDFRNELLPRGVSAVGVTGKVLKLRWQDKTLSDAFWPAA